MKVIFLRKYKEFKIGDIGTITDKNEIEFLKNTKTIEQFHNEKDKSENELEKIVLLLEKDNENLKIENKKLREENEKLKKESEVETTKGKK